ncbi:MAG TPA: ABC transporter permease [Planctomycetaceae bacterium]|jgi:putative ABC transport system permease protein|nr:ABC transporter permease [Planctomycetaceae bacterium]
MLKFAVRNLMSRPLRSLLSLVGLTVAIMGMIGLFSVAGGLNEMVADTFGRIKGLVAMQPGAPIPLFSRLPAAWGAEIAHIPGVGIVSPEIWTRANVIDGKMITSPPRFLFGADIPSRLALKQGVYRNDVVAGRFLTESDRGTLNTVISRPIAEEFHKGVGDILTVNGYDLKIVGIYYCGSLLLDVAIIVDIKEVRRINRFGSDSVSAYYIEQAGDVSDPVLTRRIQDTFKGREIQPWQASSSRESLTTLTTGNLLIDFLAQLLSQLPFPSTSPGGPTGSGAANRPTKTAKPAPLPIEVRSATDWAARFQDFSADLNLFLTIMSGIGVTIAVLSIVNTMLMSVTERIIEFGILKANGWSRYDVMRLITSESAVLGLFGGISGCLVGWGGTGIINSIWPDRIHLVAGPGLLLFGVAFSTALGVLGGLYPALWAMRMMPMDAIRRG